MTVRHRNCPHYCCWTSSATQKYGDLGTKCLFLYYTIGMDTTRPLTEAGRAIANPHNFIVRLFSSRHRLCLSCDSLVHPTNCDEIRWTMCLTVTITFLLSPLLSSLFLKQSSLLRTKEEQHWELLLIVNMPQECKSNARRQASSGAVSKLQWEKLASWPGTCNPLQERAQLTAP